MFQPYIKLIEYQTRPADAAQNNRLVCDLVDAANGAGLAALGYQAYDFGDGRFLHIASVDTEAAKETLHGLEAFQKWAQNLTQTWGISPKFTDVAKIAPVTARAGG